MTGSAAIIHAVSGMPRWLLPLIAVAWGGGAYAAWKGYWLPMIVLLGLGVLAATVAAGSVYAMRATAKAAGRRAADASAAAADAGGAGERTVEAEAKRRRDEAKKRQERNRRRRRRQ